MSILASASNLVNQAVATVRERTQPLVIWLSRKLRLTFNPRPRRTLARLTALLLLPYVPSLALAAPVGGQVVSGSATIAKPNASTVQINQTTNKAVLEWQKFSIARGESVIFNQPNASSVALNRVLGGDPSQIFGSLKANGSVFLVNPAGVLFAPGASVNVGGLVGSTLSISNADFNAGNYRFVNSGKAGEVLNQGSINAANGYVGLIGPRVGNDGKIIADAGSVGFGAGDKVTLSFGSTGLLNIKVDAAAVAASIDNKGTVQADGGQVQFVARSADALLGTVVNNSGIVRANALVARDGKILLDGGPRGVVSVNGNGSLQAKGDVAGSQGGEIKVLGDKVGLFDNASIDASGQKGGGTVLLGGNYQGKGVEANASFSYVGEKASIKADAVQEGTGGKVIVWADEKTTFDGTISARGGAQGGDGGFVETSGKQVLQVFGNVDAGAAHGKGGTWLLDPNNISINNVNSNSRISTASNVLSANDEDAVVSNTVLGAALRNNTTVNIFTGSTGSQDGNITVNSTVTATGDATLNLNARGNIIFTAAGKLLHGANTNTLNVNLNAGTNASGNSPGTHVSSITMANGSQIVTRDGAVSATARGDIVLAGIDTSASGSSDGHLTVTSNGGNITQVSALTVGGTARLNAGSGGVNFGTHNNKISRLGNVTSTGGDFTLNNTGSTGTLVARAGSVFDATGNDITINAGTFGFEFDTGSNTTVRANNLTLQSDDGFRLQNGTYNVSNTITLKPFTASQPIRLNASSNGTSLALNSSEITALRDSSTPNIVIGTEGGTGLVTLVGAVNLAGKNVTLQGGTFTDGDSTTRILTAGTLTLKANNANGKIGDAPDDKPLDVVVTNLALSTKDNNNTLAFINSLGAVNIKGANVGSAGTLTLTSAGDVTQDAAITAGTLTVSTSADNVNLSGATNHISNIGGITASGKTVSLTNDMALAQTGVITAETLVVNNSAATTFTNNTNVINELGNITGGAFNLKNSGTALTLTGAVSLGSNDFTVDTGGAAFTFGSSNAITAGAFNVTATGISQSDVLNLAAKANLNASGATLNLNNAANSFSGSLALRNTGANAITVKAGASGVTLGDVTTANNLALTSQGHVAQATDSALHVTGTTTVTLDTTPNLNVTLGNANNDSAGQVIIATPTGGASLSALSLTNKNASTALPSYPISLGSLTLNYNKALPLPSGLSVASLNVTSSGKVSQLGAITVTGATSITAGNGISLEQAANSLQGTVALNNSDTVATTVSNAHALNLGASDVKGDLTLTTTVGGVSLSGDVAVDKNLTLTSAGAVAQSSGKLTVTGTSSIDANANAITLGATDNGFVGAVTAKNSGGGNTITLKGTGAITLGAINTSASVTVVAGSIAQSGGVIDATLGGSFTAKAGDIVLGASGNDFHDSVVNLETTQSNSAISLASSKAIVLGNVKAEGSLSVDAGSSIHDGTTTVISPLMNSSVLEVKGTTSLVSNGNKINLQSGGKFTDAVSINAGTTGEVNLTADTSSALKLGNITGGKLNIEAGSIAQDSGAIDASGTSIFRAHLTALDLTKTANQFDGALGLRSSTSTKVSSTSAITLTTSAVGTDLEVTGNGITQESSGVITVGGTSKFDGDAAAVILNEVTTNQFTGAVSAKSTKNSGSSIELGNSVNLVLGQIDAGANFTATAKGISQTAAAKVAGSTSVTVTDASQDLDLGNVDNDFTGAITLTGPVTNLSLSNKHSNVSLPALPTVSNNVTLNFAGSAIELPGLTVAGNLSVTAGAGNISQQDNTKLKVTKSSTFVASGNQIVLDKASNKLGTDVSLTGGSAQIVNDAPLVLSTVALTGTGSTFKSTGAGASIGQKTDATITLDGTATFDSSNGDVLLSNNGNQFAGALTLANAKAVSLKADTGSITLANSTTSDNLTLNAKGGVILGAGTVGKALNITAGGNVSQTGVLNVTETTDITLTARNDVKLGGYANDFTGAITLHGNNLINDVELQNIHAAADSLTAFPIGLNSLSLNYANSGVKLGGTILTGNLTIDAGGVIEQTALIKVDGTTSLNAHGNAITFDQANQLTGAVTVNTTGSGKDVTLTNSQLLKLGGSSSVAGALKLTASGGVDQVGGTLKADSTEVVLTAPGHVSLNQSGNDLGAVVKVSGTDASSDIALNNNHSGGVMLTLPGTVNSLAITQDNSALDLTSSTINGNLNLTAAGISQSGGPLTVTGTTTLKSVGNSITLTNADNVFGAGLGIVSAASASIGTKVALDVNGATITAGDLTINAHGDVSQSAAISVSGKTSVSSDDAGAIKFGSYANSFTGSVQVSKATGADLYTSGDLTLDGATINGALSVKLGGNLAQNDALTASDTKINLTGSGQNVTLASTNKLGNVAISGSNAGDINLKNTSGTLSLPTSVDDLTLEYSGDIALGILAANSLTISKVAALSQADGATLRVTKGTTIGTSIDKAGSIQLANDGNSFGTSVVLNSAGAAALKTKDDLNLGASIVDGALSLTVGNAINGSGTIKVGGVTTLSAGTNSAITLNDSNNKFTSGVQIVRGGNTYLKSGSSLNLLGATITGNLTAVVDSGNLSQTGKLSVTGDSTLEATTGSIALADDTNSLGSKIKLNSSGAAELVNSGAVTLVSGSSVGGLTLTSGGNIGQTGAISVSGNSTLNLSGSGNISLAQDGNDLGSIVTITGSNTPNIDLKTTSGTLALPANVGDLTLNYTAGAISLGSVTVGGKLDVTTSDTLSQSNGAAAIVVTSGDTSIQAVNGIALGNTGNSFGGKVALNNSGSGQVTLKTMGALDLLESQITGNLDLNAGGKIGQTSGKLTVSGSTALAAGGDITLDVNNNNFGDTVSISQGENVTLADTDNIKLGVIANIDNLIIGAAGTATLLGNLEADDLKITAGGKVEQSAGKITVSTGGTQVSLTASADVLLNKTGNDLGGTVAISGVTAGADIALINAHSGGVALSLPGTQFRNLDINHSASAIVLPALDLSGNLTLSGSNQAISQGASAVKVAGATTLTAGIGSIVLNNTNNRFDTGLKIVSAGTTDLKSGSSLNLLGANITGNLTAVVTSGNLSQSGKLSVTGASTLEASAGSITLAESSNQFDGQIKLNSSGAAELVNSGAVTLVSGSKVGGLTLTSGGDIGQTGAITVSGNTTLNLSDSGNISLAQDGNDLGSSITLTGSNTPNIDLKTKSGTLTLPANVGDLKLNYTAGAIALGSVSVGGKLDVTTSDKLSQNNGATIVVTSGDTSVQAVNGIALGNVGNNFGGKVALNNSGSGQVTLNTTGALDLIESQIKGNLDLNAGGKISQTSGKLTVSGTTALAAVGDITLNASGNNFGDTVSISQGKNVTLDDVDDIKLGVIANINRLTIGAAGIATLSDDLAADELQITAGGKVEQSDGTITVGTKVSLTASGSVLLNKTGNDLGGTVAISGVAAGADIALTNVHSGGVALSLPGTQFRNLDINHSASAIVLPALDLSGNLTLNGSNQNISQSATPLKVGGATTLTAGSGTIELGATSNRFDNGLKIVSAGSANIGSASSATNLQGINISGGNFTLNATGGAITQSDAVKVSGSTTINAATHDITLNDAANELTGSVKASGGDITLKNNLALTLDNSTASGKLDLTSAAATTLAGTIMANDLVANSGAAVTQSGGSLAIGTSTTVNLVNGGNVTLDKINDLGSTVSINGSKEADDITLYNTHNGSVTLNLPNAPLKLHSLNLTQTSGSVSLSDVELTGDLTLAVTNQNISQSGGNFKVAGATKLTAGSGAITLNQAGNRFDNGLEITSASSASISTESSTTKLNGINVTGTNVTPGDFSLTTTGGAIVQNSGTVNVSGATNLAANGGNITLGNSANQLQGTVTLDGADVTLKNGLALTLGESQVSGTLDLMSGGSTTLAGNIRAGSLAVSSAGTVSQSAGTLMIDNAGTSINLTANGNVLLDKTGNDLGGKVSVAGGSVQNVSLVNAHNASSELLLPASVNDLTLDYSSALALGQVQVKGNLLAKTADALTQTSGASLQVTGTSTLNAVNGIALGNSGNNLAGSVSVNNSGTGEVLLNTSGKLALAESEVGGNLSLTAGDSISQASGKLSVTGTTKLDSVADITLSVGGNDFGEAVSITKARDVSLTDSNNLKLGAIDGVRSLTLKFNGDLTQASGTRLTVSGDTTLTEDDSSKDIILANAGNLLSGAVMVNGSVRKFELANDATNAGSISLPTVGGDLTLNFKNSGITLNGASVNGNLNIKAGQGINQTGALNVSGSSEFEAVSGIDLQSGSNSFGGAVSLRSGGNVTLGAASSLVLAGVNVTSGNLQLASSGSISQTGQINQSGGSATFNGSNILLNGSNAVNGILSFNGGSVEFTNAAPVVLGASTIGSDLKISASGAISQEAALSVTGAASFFSNGSEVDIKLGELANNFSGTVTIGAQSPGSLRDVELRNIAQVASKLELPGTLKNLKLTYDNSGISLPLATLTGNLEAKAGGDITQTGAVLVPGNAKFDAGNHAIKLDNPNNDFGQSVTLANSGKHDVSLADVNGLILAASNIGSGALTILAKGEIKQTGALVQAAGADPVSITTQGAAITLADVGNDFTGAVSLNSSGRFDVTLNDVNALTLGESKLGSGKLVITTNGALTQTGAIVQEAGASGASFAVGANSIKLDHVGNDFSGPLDLSNSGKNDVTISDLNTLQLGQVNVGSGLLSVSGKDGISQSGAIVQEAGATGISLSTETGTIMVNNANNQITGGIAINNSGSKDIVIDNKGSVLLSKITLGSGSLQVIAGGDINQNDAVLQLANGGSVRFETGSGKINIDHAENDFTGAVSLNSTSGDIKLNDKNDLILASSQLGSGTVGISSHGNLSQTGALVQAANGGLVTINADKGNISLTTAGNDFTGQVALTGAQSQIVDQNDLTLGQSNTADLTVTGQGAVTLGRSNTANLTVTSQGAVTLGESNTANLTVTGQGAVILGRSNTADLNVTSQGSVTLGQLNSANVSVASQGALNLGQGKVDGKLVANSGNSDITQSAALQVTGTSDLVAGSGNIRLVEAANDFSGTITVSAASADIVSRALAIAGTLEADLTSKSNELSFGNLQVKGKLDSSASGAVTQTDLLRVGGQASIKASGNNVTLDKANELTSIAFDAANVTVNNARALDLAGSNISGSLSVNSAGAVSQSGALVVAGPANINAGANAIKLDGSGNDFKDSVSLANTGSANAVAISAATGLKLGTVSTEGNLTVSAAGVSQDAGGVKVGGTASIDSGAASISLTSANNDFTGALSLQNSGANTVSVTDANALVLGSTSVGNGLLSVKAGGAISQTGVIKTTGESSFDAGSNAITLTAANQFGAAVKTGRWRNPDQWRRFEPEWSSRRVDRQRQWQAWPKRQPQGQWQQQPESRWRHRPVTQRQ